MGEADSDEMELEVGSRLIWLTYKRRKYSKVVEDGYAVASEPRFRQKEGDHSAKVTSGVCSFNHQRNIILQEICQLLQCDGGLKKCIHDALAFHPEDCTRTVMKKSIPCGPGIKFPFSHEGSGNTVVESIGLPFKRSDYGSKSSTVTEHCCRIFYDVIVSQNFTKLCSLLHDNGMKAQKFLDFSDINLKMKDNTYECSPLLFHSDIQQIWTNIEKVGKDIVNLARSISDESRSSFKEKLPQVGNPVKSVSANMSNEVLVEESDKLEEVRVESHPFNEPHSCSQCSKKADGRNGLVCDSCEKIYHISCIEPPVKEIPTKSWYCSNCTTNGIGFPHENCVVCERMGFHRSSDSEEDALQSSKRVQELENSFKEKVLPNCTVCRNTIRTDERYKACGHSLCPHKFYHVKCLTSSELQSHTHCWYCPSCLCRACLVDRDDHKIVLCDGCDHGYHTYCMHPPRDTIPRGQWFCNRCDIGIKNIRKARSLFENMQSKSKRGYALEKSAGVDMLLNAARTLKHEENSDARG